MKKANRSSGLLLCFAVNLLMNISWTVPAFILLFLHFYFDISIWWFIAALGVWVSVIGAWTLILSFAASSSSESDIPKENKNPYSAAAARSPR